MFNSIRAWWLLVLAGIFSAYFFACLSGCVSPGLESQIRLIQLRQDSVLTLLRSMQEKNDFVATRVGWHPPADTLPKEIPVGQSFARGPATAPMTLVEFSDLQCPYCAQLAPTLDSLTKVYPNEVRLVFKNFPLSFHPQSRAAASAAIAAGKQGKFFEFRFKVAAQFRNLNDSLYLAVAKDLGLNLVQFKKEMALTPDMSRSLDEDVALGQKLGVEGTPTVFVNGRLATDRSFEYFAKQIEQAKTRK